MTHRCVNLAWTQSFMQAVEAAEQVDREWAGGLVTLDLEAGPMQINLQDERTLGWFLLAFPRGHLLGRRLDGPGLDTLSLDVDKVPLACLLALAAAGDAVWMPCP